MEGNFKVLLEHKSFIAIDKPWGVHFHSQSGPGLISLLRESMNDSELYPVHRLDTITSGVLLVAKGKKASRGLSELFALKKVQKNYLALINKKPQKKQGRILGDMQKARNGSWKLAHTKENPADTRFFFASLAPGLRLAILKPSTGKTHQLRVAMKSLASPIVGDERYGGTPADRGYLHAWNVKFNYHGEAYTIYSHEFRGDLLEGLPLKERLVEIDNSEKLIWLNG